MCKIKVLFPSLVLLKHSLPNSFPVVRGLQTAHLGHPVVHWLPPFSKSSGRLDLAYREIEKFVCKASPNSTAKALGLSSETALTP